MNIFTKTWSGDLGWFRIAALSVLKKCQDPVKWTVCVEENTLRDLSNVIEEVSGRAGRKDVFTMISRESLAPDTIGMDGYLAQQCIKLSIHRLPWNGESVYVWDSDVIATHNFAERDFVGVTGRPLYFFTPYNSLVGGNDRDLLLARGRVVADLCRIPEVSMEWMRCFPICLIPEILRHAERREEFHRFFGLCRAGDRKTSISEFNLYGQFACMFFPDSYEWWNTQNRETWQGPHDNPRKLTAQFWSWGGVQKDVQEFVERM